MNVADNISFGSFCQLCAKISGAISTKKTSILQNYIENWKKKAKEVEKTQSQMNCSFYPVLRFLVPHLDRERGAYGVKEHTLAKIYIRILSLPKEGSDAAKLLEYKAPKVSGSGAGDFAEVAYWVLKKRCAEGGELSIEEVNKRLDAIAAKHASNNPRGVDEELIFLLKAMSAEEQKWLIRILLKDMKLGLGQNGILKTYHPDAKDLYEANNNLKKVCEILKDQGTRLHEIEIELFSPFKPMLSEECNIEKLDTYLKKSRFFYIETKLDGERFQLHKHEGDYKYFSRNGYDYTSNFGGTRFEGVLTPRIANQFSPNIKSCILDGEMMSWNPITKSFASKAKNIDVKSLKEESNHQPCFCVFDVLYYNGQILTNQPLNSRLDILSEIVNPLEGAICFVSRKRISSREEVGDSVNEAIDNREEGVVMKEFLSVYKPNVRKNSGWYKIKPEYIDGLSDTLDLLILGGYFGSGRHHGNISHFLLGVAVSVEDESPLFYSVARVGSGYSLNELCELQSKLKVFWQQTEAGKMPEEIEWTKEKPDFWVHPSKSFILEIRAAEITSSNLYRTGYTLRFPRVERVRYDKSWKDCLTLDEFEEKRKMASGKLFSHHVNENERSLGKRKLPRSNSVTLGKQFKRIDTSKIEQISNLLVGKEICVCTGFGSVSKKEVEEKVVEFGGTLTQNPGKNTFCVLAENKETIRVKNLIKSGLYDIIDTSWFFSQLTEDNNCLPEFKPGNFLSPSLKTSEILAKSYDKFGDHYTNPLTMDSIKNLMKAIEKDCENFNLSNEEKYKIDLKLFSGPSPYSFFRPCVIYFDRFFGVKTPDCEMLQKLNSLEIKIKFYGGRCCECITDETTHVIVFNKDPSRMEELNCINAKRKQKFHIVTEEWILSSIANKSLSSSFDVDESL